MWTRELERATRVRPGIDLLHDHLRGDPPLLGVASGWREQFRVVARIGRLNFAETIISAKGDRMGLRGFRTIAADDELGDQYATELMLRLGLETKAMEVHDGMLSLADGYAMVTPPKSGQKWPTATSEDARECITAHDPATGETIAGLKLYRDEWDDADFAQVFVRQDDGSVEHWTARKDGASTITESRWRMSPKWEWVDEDPGKLSRMPLIHFRNRRGRGEFEYHLDTIDRINDQILDKLIIAKVQAFRQMAVKGLPETEKKLVEGKLVEQDIDYTDAFIAAPGSLWQVPADVDFWESQITDMRPLLESIKDDLEHLSAGTATPLHIITPDAAQGSAEGAGLMRESHTDAVGACRAYAAKGWREFQATAFAFTEDAEYRRRADEAEIQVLWGPAERYSLAERADAASKAQDLPTEARWRDIWQYDPSEIKSLRALAGRDLLNQVRPPQQSGTGQPPATPQFQVPQFPPAQQGDQGDPAATS